MEPLDCCMAILVLEELKRDSPRLRPLGAHAVANRLLSILRYKALQFSLGPFVLEKGRMGAGERGGKLRPSIGSAHINDSDSFYSRLRRVDAEQARRLTVFHAAPKLALGRDDKVLVKWISVGFDFNPLPAAGYDRQNRASGGDNPHVVLKLRRVFCDRGLF